MLLAMKGVMDSGTGSGASQASGCNIMPPMLIKSIRGMPVRVKEPSACILGEDMRP